MTGKAGSAIQWGQAFSILAHTYCVYKNWSGSSLGNSKKKSLHLCYFFHYIFLILEKHAIQKVQHGDSARDVVAMLS